MARARGSTRPRGGMATSRHASYATRRREAARPAWINQYLLQWHNLGIAILLLSILLLPWRSALLALGALRDEAVQGLGYGIFRILLAVAVVGFIVLLGRFALTRRTVRWAAGCASGAVVAWGALGLVHPSGLLAGVSLRDAGAGGAFGHWLLSSLPGIAVWLLAWLATSLIFWPRRTRDTLRSLPPATLRRREPGRRIPCAPLRAGLNSPP